MVDLLAALAILLLVGGVVGTVIPLVPGGLLSLSGLYLYWWRSGFTEPGEVALVVFSTLGIVTLFVEFFGGAIAARSGGASWGTTALAAVVGIALLFVAGPLGLLVGLFATVFAVEFVRGGDLDSSGKTALYATLGVLASTAVQFLLTATILVGFLVVVFIF